MVELVKGVRLQRAGESLELVRIPSIDLHLIASWDGTEIIRQAVPQGCRFGLRPEEGWSALECLYILEGEAIWEQGSRSVTLRPGDNLSGRPVQEPCILRAATDLVALYVCSQPVFHLISAELVNLRQMAVAVEEKDGYTADHCKRIQSLSAKVGEALDLSPTRQNNLLHGSFLHDLGKVQVPTPILTKPGKLTPEEWQVMKLHTIYGREMVINTSIATAGPILEQHHERLNGSGYPHGLKGDEIALEAQIVAVVDSYDAMTSDRVYRRALPIDVAIAELRHGAGSLYRPDVVAAFLEILSETPHDEGGVDG